MLSIKSLRWERLLCCGIIVFLLVVILQPIRIHTFSRTIIDDGYYYLGYAHSFTSGQGPTFDGLVETNGVQPLWALIVIALAWVAPDHIALVYLALVVSAALSLASIYFVNRMLRSIVSDHARRITLLLYTAFVINPQMSLTGMETPVNLFMVTATLITIWHLPQAAQLTRRYLLFTGLMIGLVCLARVDNLIITPVLALLMLWRTGLWDALWQEQAWRRAIVSIIWLAIPSLVLVGIYFAFNFSVFGRFLPISGYVKSAWLERELAAQGGRFSPPHLQKSTTYALQHYLLHLNYYFWLLLATYGNITIAVRAAIAVLLAVGVLALARYRLRNRQRSSNKTLTVTRSAIILFVLALLGVFVHTWVVYFQVGATNAQQWIWYYVPEYVALTLVLSYCIEGLMRWQPPSPTVIRAMYAIIVLFMMIGAVSYLVELRNQPDTSPFSTLYDAALWANDNLPDDAVAGAFNAGVVGYFTTLHVINLDGLMNGDGILQVAQGQQTIWDYIQSEPITYIMDYSPDWTPETATFKGIPSERLDMLYSKAFIDWGGVESTYYIFRLLPD